MALLVALLVVLPGLALAADHGDGLVGFDVIAGLDLVEGPPYPAPAAEADAELRQPPEPVIPIGRQQITLVDAVDGASNDPLPFSGTLVDNGDPFGEPGDSLSLDVSFVPGAPPDDAYPQVTSFNWGLRPEPETGGPHLTFTAGPTLVLDLPLLFEAYADVEIVEASSGDSLGAARIWYRFEVSSGQALEFGTPTLVPPDAQNEFFLLFDLDQTGGASGVDPNQPLYTLTISSQTVPVPALPGPGIALLAILLTGAALAVLWRAFVAARSTRGSAF